MTTQMNDPTCPTCGETWDEISPGVFTHTLNVVHPAGSLLPVISVTTP